MRQISLREFRTRGAKALGAVPAGETVLLAGQDGPAYFLVPVDGDAATIDHELRRALAKVSLRESWRASQAAGFDNVSEPEIDDAITAVRQSRRRKSA